MKKTLSFLLFVFYFYFSYGQPGTLDESFGTNGTTITPNTYELFALSTQKGGRIIAFGNGTSPNNPRLINIAYNSNGIIDSTFGENGIITFVPDEYKAAAGSYGFVQPDQKIVIVGQGFKDKYWSDISFDSIYNFNVIVRRYMPDGMPDESFGNNGTVTSDFGKSEDADHVLIQPDGKIVVSGHRTYDPYQYPNFFMCRYMPDGSLDENFGNNGIVDIGYTDYAALALQKDGKLIVGGPGAQLYNFNLYRFNENGTIDKSFGVNGFVKTDFGSGQEFLYDIKIQDDGKIVAAGFDHYNGSGKFYTGDMAIARYNINGNLDSSFGVNGQQSIVFDNISSAARSISIQNNGKIVLAGRIYSDKKSISHFALARLNKNGLLDSTFGINGMQHLDVNTNDAFNASLLLNDGNILAGGYSSASINVDSTFALSRYLGDPTHPVASRIKRWIKNHIIHFENPNENANTAYYIVEQSNNEATGFIPISNNITVNKNEYSYSLPTTNDKLQTTNYYRIKAVNKDNSFAYSSTISSTTDDVAKENSTISIFPNPANDYITINGLNASTNYEVRIMNKEGKQVYSTNPFRGRGINISSLQSGLYFIKINDAEKEITLKFIKQ